MSSKDQMTISELSIITGVPASTIRYYLREGLISFPVKRGKTRAYYNNEHVEQLKKIKKLRKDDKLSIEEIKRNHYFSMVQAENDTDQSSAAYRKDDIITAAIDLFRSMGYDAISINDIAEKASISKATFYKYFSDKEELFYECADKVFYDIDREFKELLNEKNIMKRLSLRPSLFIKTHRHMIDMMHLVRGTSTGVGTKNSLKLKQIIANMTGPIASDLDEGIKQGLLKDMNTSIMAHILMGAVEYGIYFCEGKSDSEIEELIKTAISLIMAGVIKDPKNNL